MRYISLAFQYMRNKHFWKLVLLMLVPSVAVSLFSGFDTTAKLIVFFPQHSNFTFGEIYSFASEVNWKVLLGLLAALLVYTVLFSICIGTMQRHMRTGMFAITNIWKRINEHFWPTFLALACIFIFIYLYGLGITVAIVAWWGITHNLVATYVLTIVFMVLLFALLIAVFCLFSLTCPHMVVTGSSLVDSISVSVRSTRGVFRRLFLAVGLPLAVLMGAQFGLVFIPGIAYKIIHYIFNTAVLLFISCYYPVLIFVAYYDINDKDREDLLPINRL